jgi:hypothetical protein
MIKNLIIEYKSLISNFQIQPYCMVEVTLQIQYDFGIKIDYYPFLNMTLSVLLIRSLIKQGDPLDLSI